MRRIAYPQALLLTAALAACGDGTPPGPITDVALDSGADAAASTTNDDSSSSSGDASSGDGTSSSTATSEPATTTDATTGTPAACGDGELDDDEACDGAGAPCTALDPAFTWGDATCTAACALDTTACQTCQAPPLVPCDPQSDAVFHALELGCPDLEGWTADNGVPLLERTFASPDQDAYRVLRSYGSHLLGDLPAWSPRAGDRMLLLGTGDFGPLGVLGDLIMPPGAASAGAGNANPEADGALPEPSYIDMTDGSAVDTPFVACDGVGDCSQTLGWQWKANPHAVDIAYLDFTIEVPGGTRGYALDMAFFTAHFPEHTQSAYNDMAILWSQSEAYVGNVSHMIVDGIPRPLALPALAMADLVAHDGEDDPTLLGTGFDGLLGDHGGATDWLTVHGPAVPGEHLTLALAVLDLGDGLFDSALLVDNFRWRCESCTLGAPADQGGCGLRPAAR